MTISIFNGAHSTLSKLSYFVAPVAAFAVQSLAIKVRSVSHRVFPNEQGIMSCLKTSSFLGSFLSHPYIKKCIEISSKVYANREVSDQQLDQNLIAVCEADKWMQESSYSIDVNDGIGFSNFMKNIPFLLNIHNRVLQALKTCRVKRNLAAM